jgi:hypothetical protein
VDVRKIIQRRTRFEEGIMSRPDQTGTEAEPAPDEADEAEEALEPVTPPIDEDVAASVNAALHETDE